MKPITTPLKQKAKQVKLVPKGKGLKAVTNNTISALYKASGLKRAAGIQANINKLNEEKAKKAVVDQIDY